LNACKGKRSNLSGARVTKNKNVTLIITIHYHSLPFIQAFALLWQNQACIKQGKRFKWDNGTMVNNQITTYYNFIGKFRTSLKLGLNLRSTPLT